MLRPLGKNLLVKVKPKEKSQNGLILPDSNEPFKATIVDIGIKADLDVKVGDELLLAPFCGSKISTKDDGYLLVTERDILGVVNE